MINTKDLKLAAVRYYDNEHNGMEFTDPISHVVLFNRGDTYINLLNPGEICPVWTRVPNTTNVIGSSDEYIGTKVDIVHGDIQSGEAWLIDDTDMSSCFGREVVSLRDVENYVIFSCDYFHNRVEIIQDRLRREKMSPIRKRELIRIKEHDRVKFGEMETFFKERGVQKVKQK